MSKEISMTELALEGGELLPRREALGVFFSPNWASVNASASATALNVLTLGSVAYASAGNSVYVIQG